MESIKCVMLASTPLLAVTGTLLAVDATQPATQSTTQPASQPSSSTASQPATQPMPPTVITGIRG